MIVSRLQKKLPEYVVVFPRKVKWARIQVQSDGNVRLVVPHSFSVAEVLSIYEEKKHWVENKRARALLRKSVSIELSENEILLFGQGFRVEVDASQKRYARVDHETCCVFYAKDLLDSEQRQKWYRGFAKQYLLLRLVQLAGQHGFEFNRVFIREQKTRWGSCSSRGNISLNWKLIKAPIAVSDYVLLHELVHTQIMNHSSEFWLRVESLVPAYKDAKAWLRIYGHQL